LQGDKLFVIILPMRSKEQDSVYFHSLASWHFIPLEAAECFSKIDFNNFDYQEIFEIWSAGGGRGLCTETVLGVFTNRKVKNRKVKRITRKSIKKLAPGSYIFPDGKVVPKKPKK